MFYCPRSASDIKFEPSNTVIYYTKIFDLYDYYWNIFDHMYIVTKDSSIKTSKIEIYDYRYGQYYFYIDLIVYPIPDLTYTVSCEKCSSFDETNSYSIPTSENMSSCTVDIKVNSSDYTVKRKIAKKIFNISSK